MPGRYNRDIHHRQSIRLKNYDYSSAGAYFITICTWQMECVFGEINDGTIALNESGDIVGKCLKAIPEHFQFVDIDETVIMPNHVHMILTINRTGVACNAPTNNGNYYSRIAPKHNTLAVIIRSFKSAVTRQINLSQNTQGRPIWQSNYYEHVIRDEKKLYAIRKYIRNNPLNWNEDENNPGNTVGV